VPSAFQRLFHGKHLFVHQYEGFGVKNRGRGSGRLGPDIIREGKQALVRRDGGAVVALFFERQADILERDMVMAGLKNAAQRIGKAPLLFDILQDGVFAGRKGGEIIIPFFNAFQLAFAQPARKILSVSRHKRNRRALDEKTDGGLHHFRLQPQFIRNQLDKMLCNHESLQL